MIEILRARPPGSAALDVEALHDVLASSFAPSFGRPRLVRRTGLDTFDRRLERAGRRLQLVADAGEERLELVVRGGATAVSGLAGTGPRWPAMAAALPDGPVKDQVAQLSGIRALLVVGRCRRLVRRAELRNAGGKIVVRLVRALRGARLQRLLDDWATELCALADPARSADGATWSAGSLARADVTRAHRRVVRDGTAISDSSPPESLHRLRKRGKELRYALEMFAPVLDDAQVGKAIKDLKHLQDVLGRFQDSEVQRITLRGFAHDMVADGAPADALLAMGELMGHLHAEQQRARAEFATTFASYVRPAGLRRMARLVGGGGKAE